MKVEKSRKYSVDPASASQSAHSTTGKPANVGDKKRSSVATEMGGGNTKALAAEDKKDVKLSAQVNVSHDSKKWVSTVDRPGAGPQGAVALKHKEGTVPAGS